MPIVGGQSAHHCAYLLQLYQQILGVDQLPTDIYGGMTTMLADDFGQIEGRTEDQHIGLLTEFAKKLISLSGFFQRPNLSTPICLTFRRKTQC